MDLQTDQQRKSITTQGVSLNSCDLVYIQEQKNCSRKTYICIEIIPNGCSRKSFLRTQGKRTLNKTPVLSENMNMDFWVVGTSNQLFITGSYTETKLKKKTVDTGKTAFFMIGPSYTPHFICLNVDF